MAIIKELSKHIRAIGQKLTVDNINRFGQKALNTGR